MKKNIFILILIIFLFMISSCNLGVINNDQIMINEVCTNNKSVICNEDYKYYDYVELYNPTLEDVNLKNYGISDDKENKYQFKFKSVFIKAKDYLIVYFDKNNTNDDELTADFSLDENGESLYLTMPNGTIIQELSIPCLLKNTSYGKYNNSFEIINPSPNEQNEKYPIYHFIDNPSFSCDSGIYNSQFELSISSNNNAKIYYTLDGSVPSENSTLYKEPIIVTDPTNNPNVLKSRTDTSVAGTSITNKVDKAFIVRAIAISDDGNKSDIITKSYLINKRSYQNKKIVSLVTDNYNLYDEEYGIYVKGKAYKEYEENGKNGKEPTYNWDQTGRAWERDCNFTLIDKNEVVMSDDVGIRIHGYGGRTYYIKSFNIYARDCYNDDYLSNPIFKDTSKTKSLVLKYDRYSNSSEKFRDGFLQSLVSDANVDTQKYEMCALFLNGEYWHTYMIMQKYNDDYIEEKYGIPKDDVGLIKEQELEDGIESDYDDYLEFVNFVKRNNFNNSKNYNKLKNMIDIDSFIDLYATQIYYNHFDFSYRKNILLWKSRSVTDRPYQDGKLLWMVYDFDYAAVNKDVKKDENKTIRYDYAYNIFTGENLFALDFKDDIFFHKFMKNEDFKIRFVSRFMDLANNNFSPENVKNKLLSEYNIGNTSINIFFNNRFEYISKYLAEYININPDIVNISVETNKDIIFNSLDLSTNYSGMYYKDFVITINPLGNDYSLIDLEVVSTKDDVITLKVVGDNPKITIK